MPLRVTAGNTVDYRVELQWAGATHIVFLMTPEGEDVISLIHPLGERRRDLRLTERHRQVPRTALLLASHFLVMATQ